MSENKQNEKPEVFALRQDGGNWQISRRDFLKAAGIGAAAIGIGLNSRLVRPAFAEESLEALCKDAPAHQDNIKNLIASVDGKYLISWSEGTLKCWDFENFTLLSTREVKDITYMSAGMINGKSCLIYFVSGQYKLNVLELPDIEKSTVESISLTWAHTELVRQVSAEKNGNVYVLLLDQTHLDNKTWRVVNIKTKDDEKDLFGSSETLYSSSEEIPSFVVFDSARQLLTTDKRFKLKIAETGDEAAAELDAPASTKADAISIFPGETAVLYPAVNENTKSASYALASLPGKTLVWLQSLPDSNGMKVHNTAVTPDGSYGLLLAQLEKQKLYLISRDDGSIVKEIETGQTSNNCYDIAVSHDGTKAAIANKKSILFFSLPDLQLIGCPIDLSEMKDNTDGIEISATDAVTGKTVTYTLPCGAPIPAGAVCTCNCVAGTVPTCSCVGNTCSCVGNTCSCVSHRTYSGYHYWHPN